MQRMKIKSIIYDPLSEIPWLVWEKWNYLEILCFPLDFWLLWRLSWSLWIILGLYVWFHASKLNLFCNVHSFRLCISWRFEGFLPLFGVVLFSFCWHRRKAGCGCEQGPARCAQRQGLLPGGAAGALPVRERTAQSLPASAFKLGAVTLCPALLSSWTS